MTQLSHLDQQGACRMVDVGGKEVTVRTALAGGRVRLSAETLAMVIEQVRLEEKSGGRSGEFVRDHSAQAN
jgi:molybdenum cofactor biosynthesis enzyme